MTQQNQHFCQLISILRFFCTSIALHQSFLLVEFLSDVTMFVWDSVNQTQPVTEKIKKKKNQAVKSAFFDCRGPQLRGDYLSVKKMRRISCEREREKLHYFTSDLNFKYWHMKIVLRRSTRWHLISIYSMQRPKFAFKLSDFFLFFIFFMFSLKLAFFDFYPNDCCFQFSSDAPNQIFAALKCAIKFPI